MDLNCLLSTVDWQFTGSMNLVLVVVHGFMQGHIQTFFIEWLNPWKKVGHEVPSCLFSHPSLGLLPSCPSFAVLVKRQGWKVGDV